MLLFGHTGITLGVAALITTALNRDSRKKAGAGEAVEQSPPLLEATIKCVLTFTSH